MAAPRARNYSITKSDMEASRLVFVFVRDAKPKRKVAVPVPDGYSWDEFIKQVRTKLKIAGVKDIQLVSTGQKVTSLDELQDIDELCVTEGAESRPNGPNGSIPTQAALSAGNGGSTEITVQPERQQLMAPDRSKTAVAHAVDSSSKHGDVDDKKYAKRPHALKRLAQRWAPQLFAPTLPVSTRDAGLLSSESDKPVGKRRRVRRSLFNLRNLLLMLAIATCLMTMFWFMLKGAPIPQ